MAEEFVPAPAAAHCLGCGYALDGLATPGKCPECGRPFDLQDETTFTFKPPMLRWRYWLPALVLAMIASIASIAVCALAMGNWGMATWVAVPMCGGCLLGYGARTKAWILPVLAIVFGLGVILGMMSMSLGGIFCGLMLAGISLVPILFGGFAGWALRSILKGTNFSQRWHLPTLSV